MKKGIIITDGIELITRSDKRNNTAVTLKIDEEEIYLTTIQMQLDNAFWIDERIYENYLIIYSRGCMLNQIPFKIETVYDLKNRKIIQVTNKNRKMFEYMCIGERTFHIAEVLETLNDNKLEIAEQSKIDSFIKFLIAANKETTIDVIKAYILSKYPFLKDYSEIKRPLTVKEYNKILKDNTKHYMQFRIIPTFFNEDNNLL